MEIPVELTNIVEEIAAQVNISELKKSASEVHMKYNEAKDGKSIVKSEKEVLSYAISRMPGTYAAVSMAASAAFLKTDMKIKSLIDVGAGTGACSFAIGDIFDLKRVTLVEREENMIKVGKLLAEKSNDVLKCGTWIRADACDFECETADLVTASYVMNELNDKTKTLFLKKLWDESEKYILIVEPGSKEGFKNITMARDFYLSLGGTILAPCKHNMKCDLGDDDWCHFSCRISRTKLQKYVKAGDAPFEDEKYMYIAISKENIGVPNNEANMQNEERGIQKNKSGAESESGVAKNEYDMKESEPGVAKTKSDIRENGRVIRHPNIQKGFIALKLCTVNGTREVKITGKDKERFKAAKKVKWGEEF